jgi:ABC-2 type transport system ATP-binding protein
MAQKIQFIATVLHDPQIIILDEPFSGFDPVNANLIRDEIFQLRNQGKTIIFSTHRMESVEELCDDVALINHARVVLKGEKFSIKDSFRTGKYVVEYEGELDGATDLFEVKNTERLRESISRSVIETRNGKGSNEVIRILLDNIQIHRFEEVIPSMNDIFISVVNAKSNE